MKTKTEPQPEKCSTGDEPQYPVISVILPTLNAERTLEKCLASIRAQVYPRDRIEIIMADAGSSDKTVNIAKHFGVDTIVPNPLKTGEAGKSAAIEASTGEILALIDSDNIFDDTHYFAKAASLFSYAGIDSVEPLGWTFDPEDTLVNRYCALLGMNDPVSYFLGNYNRYSHLSRKFTGMDVYILNETPDAYTVEISPCEVPTFGANGFMIRRTALEHAVWKPYYFDIDIFQQVVRSGHSQIGVIKTETRHLFCNSVSSFRKKQARRIQDYHFHAKNDTRTNYYRTIPKWKYGAFVLSTVTVLPLLWQSLRGYSHKPDRAWWFHLPACWITLWEYGWGTLRSAVRPAEYDRSEWKQ